MPVKCISSGPDYLALGLPMYDWARAELELARRTLPNDPTIYFETALTDRRQGRWAEALRNFERAIELDPCNVEYLRDTAGACSSMRRYAEADRIGRRALALSPHDNWLRIFLASQPLAERADTQPLRSELNAILSENPDAAPSLLGDLWHCAMVERDLAAAERALAASPARGRPGLFGFHCAAGMVCRLHRSHIQSPRDGSRRFHCHARHRGKAAARQPR